MNEGISVNDPGIQRNAHIVEPCIVIIISLPLACISSVDIIVDTHRVISVGAVQGGIDTVARCVCVGIIVRFLIIKVQSGVNAVSVFAYGTYDCIGNILRGGFHFIDLDIEITQVVVRIENGRRGAEVPGGANAAWIVRITDGACWRLAVTRSIVECIASVSAERYADAVIFPVNLCQVIVRRARIAGLYIHVTEICSRINIIETPFRRAWIRVPVA